MIPLYKPYIEKSENLAVLNVLKSGKLSRGQEVKKFENNFKSFVDQKYAIATNSGTSGLFVAVQAVGWEKGDEIITTSFSYIASANCLLHAGIKPIFVDIDPESLNIDVDKIERHITARTKGILLVHIFGLPVNIDKLLQLKKKYHLQIIEDACEAIGQPSRDFPVTKAGDITIYGFHENKQITTAGEGGMITTNNAKLAKCCRSLCDQGRASGRSWLANVRLGYNYRMTEIQAAFGSAQLKKIKRILKYRDWISSRYNHYLSPINKRIILPNLSMRRSWFLYFIVLNNRQEREDVYKALSRAGIASSKNYFLPIYCFPMYSKYRKDICKKAEYISERILALPMYYGLSESKIKLIKKNY